MLFVAGSDAVRLLVVLGGSVRTNLDADSVLRGFGIRAKDSWNFGG